MKTKILLLFLAFFICGCSQNSNSPVPYYDQSQIQEAIEPDKLLTIFIIDSSGSMQNIDKKSSLSMMQTAKKNLKDIALKLDTTKTNLSLIKFDGACSADVLIKATNNVDYFTNQVSSIKAQGFTPLSRAIEKAGQLAAQSKKGANIIILSDGIESCNGDPQYQVKTLTNLYHFININIFVIGYGVDVSTSLYLKNLVFGSGIYYNVTNAISLTNALNNITTKLKINQVGWENGVYDFRINFDHDKDIIKPEFIENVQNLANFLLKSGNLVQIQGHTDNVGDSSYNKNLSLKRANAVKKALISLGVDESKITTIGYGEDLPKVPNTTMENKYKNRRVEAHILR